MKKRLIAAGLLGLAVALGAVPSVVPAQAAAAQAARGWKFAGKYRTYKAACQKAECLEDQGYETCIQQQGGGWCVYCR